MLTRIRDDTRPIDVAGSPEPGPAGRDRSVSPARRLGPVWAVAGLVVIAFALRLYRLGAPSLGFDEAWNLLVSGPEFHTLFDLLTSHQPYPPLHFVLLRGWQELAGQTEFGARYWALMSGVVLIPLLYQVGRTWLGVGAGLAAAALATFSPAYLWYAQEIKMYALLAALMAASLLTFARLSVREPAAGGRSGGGGSPWLWEAYVLTTAAALYVHYTAILVIGFEFLAAWALARRGGRRAIARWIGAQAAIVALYLPWLWAARHQLGTYQSDAPSTVSPVALAQSLWRVFSVGYSDELQHRLSEEAWVVAFWIALCALATVALMWRGGHKQSIWLRYLAVGSFLVPLGLFVVAEFRNPVLAARHATVISIGYYLVVGGGLARLALDRVWGRPGRAIALAGAGVLAGIWAVSLANYYFDPAYTRTDNRAVAHYVRDHATPADVLIFNAPFFGPAVLHYQPGPMATTGLPAERPLDPDVTAARLRDLVRSHPQIWLALWQDYFSDPDHFVERWLDRNATRQVDKQFASIRLLGYSTADQPLTGATPAHPLAGEFGGRIGLRGYSLGRDPAGALRLELYWRSIQPVETTFTVFVHVLDTAGRRVGQWDQQPKGGLAPTQQWRAGEVIRDPYRITLDPGAEPRHLDIGLYDSATQARLPVTAGAPAGSTALRIALSPTAP